MGMEQLMPLKLRLKTGDKLILGQAYLEIERVGLTSVSVSVDAPQEIAILTVRNTACDSSENDSEYDSR